MAAFSSLLIDWMDSAGAAAASAPGSSPVSTTDPTASDLSHRLPTNSNDATRTVTGRSCPVVHSRTDSTREKSSRSSPPNVSRRSVRTGIRRRYHVWGVPSSSNVVSELRKNGLLASPPSSSGIV